MPVTASDATFQSYRAALSSPAEHVALVTKSDTDELANASRGISFAGVGALKVTMVSGGDPVIIPSGALAAGVIHPLRVKQVWSTDTGATGIVAYW